MTPRRFPPPWTVQRLPGGFKVTDANGQSLAYFYARENDNDAGTAGVLTMDETLGEQLRQAAGAARQGLEHRVASEMTTCHKCNTTCSEPLGEVQPPHAPRDCAS